MKVSQLERSGSMLKRRPSKRFVLAETGEESAWNTTTDNDPTAPITSTSTPAPPQIEVQVGLTTSASTSKIEDAGETSEIPTTSNAQLLTVPQPIKTGLK